MPKIELIQGDCLEKMKDMESNSVDAIITDPPYEFGFMGKTWDSTGIANSVEMWKEALRVLKHGGHLLAFSGTRTYHRMACAIEDAGFEVRDMIEWVYGSGFPKSLNIGKAVDKLQGNEREDLGEIKKLQSYGYEGNNVFGGDIDRQGKMKVTKGTSEWEGWGTALKPAHEPICMARKPLAEKTVAENVLKYGTGGINIDESRVGTETISIHNAPKGTFAGGEPDRGSDTESYRDSVGRFPANLIHDNSEEVRECFPDVHGAGSKKRAGGWESNGGWGFIGKGKYGGARHGDSGNASRFFKSIIYTAKASKSERNKGCEELQDKIGCGMNGTENQTLLTGSGNIRNNIMKNNHPTVKPVALMEYLIKMVTPAKGIVLDPFMGSGTTGVACKNLNRNFIGIELDENYFVIAKKRINENL